VPRGPPKFGRSSRLQHIIQVGQASDRGPSCNVLLGCDKYSSADVIGYDDTRNVTAMGAVVGFAG
jgi:hypothetical protein